MDTVEGAASVRLGDVYALVVDTYATQGEWTLALHMLRDMNARGIDSEGCIESSLLREVHRNNGLPVPSSGTQVTGRGGNDRAVSGGNGDGDEIEEEISGEDSRDGQDRREGVDDVEDEEDMFGF